MYRCATVTCQLMHRPCHRKERTVASESRTEDRLPAPIRTGDPFWLPRARHVVGQVMVSRENYLHGISYMEYTWIYIYDIQLYIYISWYPMLN